MKNQLKVLKDCCRAMGMPGKIKSLHILQHIAINCGHAIITDLDTRLELCLNSAHLPNEDVSMLLDMKTFLETLNIKYSKNVDGVNEFPLCPELTKRRKVNPKLFSQSYKPLLCCANTDDSRPALNNVNFQPGFGIWCADGHKAMILNNNKVNYPLSVLPEVVKLLDILLKEKEEIISVTINNPTEKPWKKPSKKQAELLEEKRKKVKLLMKNDFRHQDKLYEISGKIEKKLNNFDVNYKYIEILTTNCRIVSKMLPETLVRLDRAMPKQDKCKQFNLSLEQILILKACVKKLLPYANKKTFLMKLHQNEISTIKEGKTIAIYLPFTTFDFLIGFNGKYLIEILSSFDENINIKHTTKIQGITFNQKGKQCLLMPLRILEGDECFIINHLPLPKTIKKTTDKALKQLCQKLIKESNKINWPKELLNIKRSIDNIKRNIN